MGTFELERLLDFFKRLFAFDADSPLLFTQFYFWAFFAIVYAIFSLTGKKLHLRNAYLLLVSLLFYYKTSGLSLLLLLFVICSDFIFALCSARCRGWGRKFFLVCSIVVDLGILCYFKYSYFFIDFVNTVFGTEFEVVNLLGRFANTLSGREFFSVDSIILPVGISFFIFQLISYSVDVYRKDTEPVRNILDFGFYVSFFPQLVAGPIVRAKDFVPQLYRPFHLGRRQFGIAVFWILNGLIKKIVLSDYLAVNFVDRVFENPLLFTGFENLSALIGYALQVYADFSGYTDIAIGVAMLMGFYLPKNFNSPYKASNPQDFWRRWHMSLSNWLKSYLYIPLGGNRRASFGTFFWISLFAAVAVILSGRWETSIIFAAIFLIVLVVGIFFPSARNKVFANINRLITMLLGGLWHGASWNFIIWGGLNGFGLIVFQWWKNMAWWLRMLLTASLTALCFTMAALFPSPAWNIFSVWTAVVLAGTSIRFIYHLFKGNGCHAIGRIWGTAQTFVFIIFTYLFFRSGSNLDPATANETAWNTAGAMVNQIGSAWNISVIPDICEAYWKVFALIVAGFVIHLIPDSSKRRLRLNFAMLPLPVMVLACVLAVFLVYQFVTADLQPFIYFQF